MSAEELPQPLATQLAPTTTAPCQAAKLTMKMKMKAVAEWKRRTAVGDLRAEPKDARSTILSIEEEAITFS